MNTNTEEILAMDLSPRWYALQTYVGFEEAVKKILEQKISNLSLDKKILEVYIPTKTIVKVNKSGERKEKEEKIYPGYIYINMILDKEIGYLIQNTQYISRIAGTGDMAVALEDGYVDKIKKSIIDNNSGKNQQEQKIPFVVGDLVKVKTGPFKDMQGKICARNNEGKVNVLLTIFDRETEVELDVVEIDKVLE